MDINVNPDKYRQFDQKIIKKFGIEILKDPETRGKLEKIIGGDYSVENLTDFVKKAAPFAGGAIGGAVTAGTLDAAASLGLALFLLDVLGGVTIAGVAASGLVAAAPVVAPILGAAAAYGATKGIVALSGRIFNALCPEKKEEEPLSVK